MTMRTPALALGLALWLPTGRAAENTSPLDLARQLNRAFVQVAAKVKPSVVVIHVAKQREQAIQLPNFGGPLGPDDPLFRRFFENLPKEFRDQFPQPSPDAPEKPRRDNGNSPFTGSGSGIVVTADGYILTNRQVIEDATRLKVITADGREHPARLRGVDTQSDLAVIKIDAKNLRPAQFAETSNVHIGEFAIAIGAPYRLDYTFTVGHVSAKGRNRLINNPAFDQDFIQTDASINPGNSGGPLVNIDGQVIGVNTMIRGLNTGIGFAIPSTFARQVAQKIIRHGKVPRARLGISIQSLRENPDLRDLAKGLREGVMVREIQPDGPAAKSDLKPFDIITAVADTPVHTAQDLRSAVRFQPIGQPLTLHIQRAGKPLKITIRPEEWLPTR